MSMLPTLPCGMCGTPITANYCTGCGEQTTSELPSFDIRTEDDLRIKPRKKKDDSQICSVCHTKGMGIFCIECGASLETKKQEQLYKQPTTPQTRQLVSMLRMMSLAK